ncbi:hypothetical protein A2U01_0090405 [Trifolium medium]|uniref:Uncharacterized protein n=1 Tax=Trifolium medium TaxID=97028 RepID=A0A392U8M2_9FABA|nr:hypothetical protein [Trifolium medium]
MKRMKKSEAEIVPASCAWCAGIGTLCAGSGAWCAEVCERMGATGSCA